MLRELPTALAGGTILVRSVFAAVTASIIFVDAARAQIIEGTWSGIATLRPDSGLPVGVRLKIDRPKNSLRVRLSLPESRLVDLELPSPYSDSSYATYANGHLRAEFTPDLGLAIISRIVQHDEERIVFDGDLSENRLAGTIRITTYRSPITLRREAESPREPEIHFSSARDSMPLGGKLVLPSGKGPFPAAVFVTGSDPDTREAWQLEARALAGSGIASLLYDKRGVGESAGANHDLASWDDLTGDVEGAVAYLRSRRDVIDPKRIGLIGQSHGTWIIAKVAVIAAQHAFNGEVYGRSIKSAAA